MTDVIRQHVEILRGAGGPKARITGHRIRVLDVVIWDEKQGMSPDGIVSQYPTLTLADVYAALAYYLDHRDEIDQAIAQEDALAEEICRTHTGPLEEKLKRLRRG